MNNPKTTVAGIILGSVMAAQPIIENGDFEPKRDWIKIVVSVGVFILGIFAHDPRKRV